MDARKISIFLTYIHSASMREAAELLRMNHVGVLRAIRELEEEVGSPLLLRAGRRFRLTEIGQRLRQSGGAFLAEQEKFRRRVLGADLESADVARIATFEVFSTYLSPEIEAVCGKSGTRTSWLERVPGQIENAVAAGEADFGVTYLPVARDGVEHLAVANVRMAAFGTARFRGKTLDRLPFVVPAQDAYVTPTKAKGLDGWPDGKIPRTVRHRVSLLETALALARKGFAVGYFPEFVVERMNAELKEEYRLHPIKLEAAVERKLEREQAVYLVKPRDREETRILRDVAKVLRTLR